MIKPTPVPDASQSFFPKTENLGKHNLVRHFIFLFLSNFEICLYERGTVINSHVHRWN